MGILIGSKGQAHVQHAQKQAKTSEDVFSPGKSADSVGHRAKVNVADIGDRSPNAIGQAASLIARLDLTARAAPPTEIVAPVDEQKPDLFDPIEASEDTIHDELVDPEIEAARSS